MAVVTGHRSCRHAWCRSRRPPVARCSSPTRRDYRPTPPAAPRSSPPTPLPSRPASPATSTLPAGCSSSPRLSTSAGATAAPTSAATARTAERPRTIQRHRRRTPRLNCRWSTRFAGGRRAARTLSTRPRTGGSNDANRARSATGALDLHLPRREPAAETTRSATDRPQERPETYGRETGGSNDAKRDRSAAGTPGDLRQGNRRQKRREARPICRWNARRDVPFARLRTPRDHCERPRAASFERDPAQRASPPGAGTGRVAWAARPAPWPGPGLPSLSGCADRRCSS